MKKHVLFKIMPGCLVLFFLFIMQPTFAQVEPPPPPEISGGAKGYIQMQEFLEKNPDWKPTPIPQAPIPGEKALTGLLNNWDAIGFGGNNTFFAPPDPIGAAGQNHVVNVVNVSIEWYTKAGVQQNSQTLQSFFGSITSTFDPKVIYDQYEDRFVVVTLEQQGRGDANVANDVSNIYVAVSKTGDPNAGWWFTTINSVTSINGANHWADYPGFAADEEAVYITNNMFSHASDSYGGVRLWVIDKGVVGGFYAGTAAGVSIHDPYAIAGNATTTQPAHTFGAPPAGVGTYLLSQDGGSVAGAERIQWVRVDNPLGAISFTQGFTSLGDITTGFAFPDAPQLGGGTVQTNDRRALNAVWRNGLIATCFTMEGIGPDAGQATAHWLLLNDNGGGIPTLNDQGSISGEDIAPGTFTFFPSVALNMNNDLAIGFSASAPTIWPGAYFTAHEAADPAGVVQPSVTLRAGTLNYNIFSTRWGDYSGTVVDGADDLCFWVFNEYAGQDAMGSSIWATAWGNFCVQAPVCSINATAVVTPESCSGANDAMITINAMAMGCAGTLEYSLNGGAFQASNVFMNLAPAVYTVVVRCSTDPACTTTLMVTVVASTLPCNDLCANAEPVACGGSVIVDITGATGNDNPGTCVTFGANEPGVWYTVTGTGGNINITTCNPGTNYDTKITVWDGTCGALNCITGNDDQLGGFDAACDVTGIGFNRGSTVDFCSVLGTTYYIYLYGFASAVGTAQMSVTCDPPLMVTCPPASLGTITCNDPIPPAATTIAQFIALGGTVTGGCAPTVTSVDDLQPPGDICGGQTLTRTYTVSDANNSFDCVQTLTISPPNPPTVVCPPDMTVQCEADIMVDAANATVTTDCGQGFTSWVTQPDIVGARDCDGTTYTYTYKAVDDCGQLGSCTQTWTLSNAPPTISVPAGTTVECAADIVTDPSDATVTVSCGDPDDLDVTIYAPVLSGTADCSGTTYTYTYRVEDQCEREATADRVFTIGTGADPVVTAPDDTTCECLGGITPNPANASVETSCGVDANVTAAITSTSGPQDCPGTTYTVTYSATDDCNRSGSDNQTFTIQNGPPVFLNAPTVPLQLNCEDQGWEYIIQAWLASVKATNSCGLPLTVLNNYNPNSQGVCINNGTTVVTWRATDNCGRQSVAQSMIIINDTEPPVFTTPAQDELDICNYNTPAEFAAWVAAHGNAVAVDGCDQNITNNQWSTIPNNPQFPNCMNAMGSTSMTVTFVVRDDCGNKTSTTATFTALMTGGDFVEQGDGEVEMANGFELMQNKPNPFKDETLIGFVLPEDMPATLTIFDVSGKRLKVFQGDYNKGYNEVQISRSELNTYGILFYQLETENQRLSKKMVILE